VCDAPERIDLSIKKDYDRVNSELFDPRIVNDDYEPHEEEAKVRGYIPNADGETCPLMESEPPVDPRSPGEEVPESSGGAFPVDGRSSENCGVEAPVERLVEEEPGPVRE
jgi:hypothetical protein